MIQLATRKIMAALKSTAEVRNCTDLTQKLLGTQNKDINFRHHDRIYHIFDGRETRDKA